ncbi:MAG: hypothetical protein ACFFCY_06940 [Promethearchaeota archaeon]
MNGNDFKYCFLKNDIFYIKDELKTKGKVYGIATLNLKEINALAECIDLQSVASTASPKFSQRIESFLLPRIDEIVRIIYTIKPLPDSFQIEFSKENLDDIIKSLRSSSVVIGLKDRGYSVDILSVALKKTKFEKYR